MSKDGVIRWGIVGCGDVCEVKSGPGFQKAEGSALTVVMRRDSAKAEDYAKRHGVPRWTSDADGVINADDVDAVYVATPVRDHKAYALRAAAAGKPCYVEKPMARSHAECLAMCEAAEAAGQPLYVAYYRRRLPRFVKAKRLIDDGTLGRITSVDYVYTAPRHRQDGAADDPPWRVSAEHAGGGLFFDLGSHTLDILDHLVGGVGEATGFASNRASKYDVEDTVAMTWRYEDGAVGCGLWNFASALHRDVITITGTDAALRMSTFGEEPVELVRGNDVDRFDLPHPPHAQQPLIQSIVDELLGKAAPGSNDACPSTGRSAARTAKVMDDAVKDYYGGRDDAFWDRPDSWPGRRDPI